MSPCTSTREVSYVMSPCTSTREASYQGQCDVTIALCTSTREVSYNLLCTAVGLQIFMGIGQYTTQPLPESNRSVYYTQLLVSFTTKVAIPKFLHFYYNEAFEHGVPSLLKVAHKRIKLLVIAAQLFVKPRQRSDTPLSLISDNNERRKNVSSPSR